MKFQSLFSIVLFLVATFFLASPALAEAPVTVFDVLESFSVDSSALQDGQITPKGDAARGFLVGDLDDDFRFVIEGLPSGGVLHAVATACNAPPHLIRMDGDDYRLGTETVGTSESFRIGSAHRSGSVWHPSYVQLE